jgi:hypothetical protein
MSSATVMMTKRKQLYSSKILKIIESAKNIKSKAALFCERGWKKEDDKLRSIEDVGLQWKTTRLCEKSNTDECLYKWFLQKHTERVLINRAILKSQAVQLKELISGRETFQASKGLLRR